MALPILHLFAGILYSYALWYDQKYVEVNFVDGIDGYPFKNRVLFLTMWTLALQALYMTIAFLNDVIGTNAASPRKPPAIRRIKDITFTIAYPTAIYVSIAFWGVYHVQKDLMFPEHVERAYPPWLNHVMHTITAVFINIEMFTAHIDYPSKAINFFIGQVYIISYLAWLFIIYAQTGLWPYAVLIYVKWPTRLVLMLSSVILGNVFNMFGWALNRKLSCKVKTA